MIITFDNIPYISSASLSGLAVKQHEESVKATPGTDDGWSDDIAARDGTS
ncbi:hypothetical protein H1230_16645 [Paenibacillus sp. 19GGS1-52]|nr:hypothetical protein [Paenibacillus sp. 19GGS1-52]ULO04784.1 hypothetical protein H1230_16645 [Paenibacillus sp. 19GGS1-52]